MQHTLNTAGLRAILAMHGRRILMALAALALAPCVFAEDGYDLWLRYVPVQAQWLAPYRSGATQLVMSAEGSGALSPTLAAARDELDRGLAGLLGAAPSSSESVTEDGALLLGTGRSPAIAALRL